MQEETLNIEILDEIGGWGFTFNDLYAKAKGYKGSKIRVPVNSYGGSVLEALLIYNYLRGHKAEVETHIPAYAMSAGTIIASAGDRVTMAENGYYMIHNPWNVVVGEADDMKHVATVLEKMKADMVDIYYNRTKRKIGKKDISKMMDDETWLTAREAYEMGFVDELTQGAKIEASFDPDKLRNFNHVPEGFKALFHNNQTASEMTIADQILNTLKGWFGMKHDASEQEVQAGLQSGLDAIKAGIRTEVETELNAQHADVVAAMKAAHEQAVTDLKAAHDKALADQQAILEEKDSELEKANARIKELEKAPAGSHTGGQKGSEGDDERIVSEFTRRAAASMNRKKGLPTW